tara:strand:+ start:1068 stop:1835 length:768 start_codon:yes stop_codon:yes gene_type:complete
MANYAYLTSLDLTATSKLDASQKKINNIRDINTNSEEFIDLCIKHFRARTEDSYNAKKLKENEGTEDLVSEINLLQKSISNSLYKVTEIKLGEEEIEHIPNGKDVSDLEAKKIILEQELSNLNRNLPFEEYYEQRNLIVDNISEIVKERNSISRIKTDMTHQLEEYYKRTTNSDAVKRTSYNTSGNVHLLDRSPFRKNYAQIGGIYDPKRDAFYKPQPYPSWTLNESTCLWAAPLEKPAGSGWNWSEETLTWEQK